MLTLQRYYIQQQHKHHKLHRRLHLQHKLYMITAYEQSRVRDHGEAMIVVRLLTTLLFMMQLQIWMQLSVLAFLLKIRFLEI